MKLLVPAARRMFAVLDWPLLALLIVMALVGMATMHSAVGNTDWRFSDQLRNFVIAFVVMWGVALLRPTWILKMAPYVYALGIALLVAVTLFGATSKGATRWLDVGVARIQPSEMMTAASAKSRVFNSPMNMHVISLKATKSSVSSFSSSARRHTARREVRLPPLVRAASTICQYFSSSIASSSL